MKMKDAYASLCDEYIATIQHCDECIADDYCRKHDLKMMKCADWCSEFIKKYFRDRKGDRV